MAIRSTTGDAVRLGQAVQLVTDYLQDTPGLILRRYEQNGSPSVVALTHDTLKPDLLLMGHVDVVPGRDDQFLPTEREGKLFGRGACDMKSGIAAMAWLWKILATEHKDLSVTLMLTSDEETGGQDGTRHLIEDVGYRPKFAIIPDGGNGPDDVIVENKGLLQLRLTAHGKAAHASRPWEGINAAEQMMLAVQRIKSLFSEPSATVWGDTCTPTTFSGGNGSNQVPESATCTLDIRITAQTKQGDLLEQIRTAATPCDIELLLRGDPSQTLQTHPLLQAYAKLVPKYFGKQASFNRTPGGNDGRFLSPLGVPLLIVRPPSGGLHGPEEWVDIKGLEDYARLLLEYSITIIPDLKSMPTH